jgi:23S rRNA (adenine2503-C2)-methyltransferase
VPLPLTSVLPDELARACTIDIQDARRIISLVHRQGALPDKAPATIRRAALDAARATGFIPSLALLERRASAVDPFVKYAFRLEDGSAIETVRIPLEITGRFSVCVSSQAGCALACAFCATGRMGLSRNLEAWEIVEQVRRVRKDLEESPTPSPSPTAQKPRVHGVLFQGMGEPLANVERVIQAIRVMSEPSALAIDMRNITVCTSGLPSGIRALLREVPAVRLGISIGSARKEQRRAIMPIDGAHPLAEVLAAAGEHARATRMAPMFAYTLLAGVNDADEDALALAALVRSFAEEYGIRPRLSLIPYNSIAAEGAPDPFSPSDRLAAFRAALSEASVGSIVRYSGGFDVGAACGQLARPAAGRRSAARGRLVVDPDSSTR